MGETHHAEESLEAGGELKSADELINEIFAVFNERYPREDPGDLTIDVQDDMPVVSVYADGRGLLAHGMTLEDALHGAIEAAKTKDFEAIRAEAAAMIEADTEFSQD